MRSCSPPKGGGGGGGGAKSATIRLWLSTASVHGKATFIAEPLVTCVDAWSLGGGGGSDHASTQTNTLPKIKECNRFYEPT